MDKITQGLSNEVHGDHLNSYKNVGLGSASLRPKKYQLLKILELNMNVLSY